MKCTNCNSEMIELKKGGPLTNNSMEPGSNVESIVYDIDYDKAKDILPKIMETKGNKLYITPEMYVCPECGEKLIQAGPLWLGKIQNKKFDIIIYIRSHM